MVVRFGVVKGDDVAPLTVTSVHVIPSVDCCHLKALVLPFKLRLMLVELPEQIVVVDAVAVIEGVEFTVMVTVAELDPRQAPLVKTAL